MSALSVIVRTCNRPNMLARALACVAGQTRRPDEIVVVNEGGQLEPVRQAVKVAGTSLRIILLEHEHPKGRGAALNTGIRVSTGDWLAILDDDDTWEPEFVEEMMGRIEEQSGCHAVACQTLVVVENVDSSGQTREVDRGILNPDFVAVDLTMLAAWNQFTINALIFSRVTWQEIGPFRENISMLEDWEFNVRLALRHDIAVVAQPLAHYRRRPAARESFANSSEREHEVVRRHLVNEWLREDVRLGRAGLGQLAALGLIRREVQRLHPLVSVYERCRRRWRRLLGRHL